MDVKKDNQQDTPQAGEQLAAAQIGDSSPLQAGEALPDVSALVEELEEGQQIGETAAADKEEAAADRKGYHIERGESGEPNAIILNVPPYNPKLDPNSPEFDIELWKEEFSKVDLTAARERMQESAARIAQSVSDQLTPDYLGLVSVSMQNLVNNTASAIRGAKSVTETVKNAVINTSRIAAESQKMIEALLSPDFMQRLEDAVSKLVLELPPEELEALRAEIAEDTAAAEDENQTSLFDEEEPDTGSSQAFIPPEDFIQLFAESPAEEQPEPAKRKRKPRLEKLVEQGLETILQNNTTNQLTKFSGKDAEIDSITGTAKFIRGDFILTIPNYLNLQGLKTSTWQLLDALFIKFTADPRKSKTTVITLDEYMQRRKLKKRQKAKEQAIADMEILRSAGITLEERKGKSRVSYRFVNLAQSGSVERNGDIIITWTDAVHTDLITAPVMPYPPQLQEVNPRLFPNAYYMGRKAAELKNMNALHANAGDIISVKTLLENAPYIPSFEEVAAADRAFTRRIIEPFERDLTALQGAFSWEYCHRNGTPLTAEELESFSYDTFIACNVKLTWTDYPDQTKRRETLEAKIEKAQAGEKRKRGKPKKQPQES